MPIQFRCAYCQQLLGIARRKAGTVITCPTCSRKVIVPRPPEPKVSSEDHPSPQDDEVDLLEQSDIDVLLRPPKTGREEHSARSPGHRQENGAGGTVSSASEQAIRSEPLATGQESTSTTDRLGIRPGHSRVLIRQNKGLTITPGWATVLVVVLVLLLAASFVGGLLTGRAYWSKAVPASAGSIR